MAKFTCSKFELDLANYAISTTEENYWFSDRFLTKKTYPITLTVTDELNDKFGDLLSYSSGNRDTYEEGYFTHLGEIHEAVLEVVDRIGREISVEIRFGYEELPNAKTKLRDLPLEKIDIATETAFANIYEYAESIITQTWPDVSHNFVMVHTNKFDLDSDQWEFFEGVINKYVNGAFVENEYDAVNDIQINRNIMQPQPYLMHILEAGFAQSGRVLKGDLVNDVNFKKALLSEISEYYSVVNTEKTEHRMVMADFYEEQYAKYTWYGKYEQTIPLSGFGRYKLAGNLYLRKTYVYAYIEIYLGSSLIYRFGKNSGSDEGTYYKQLDLNFNHLQGAIDLRIESYNMSRYRHDFDVNEDDEGVIFDVSLTKISEYDANGVFQPTLIVPTKIDLAETVPDLNFGDLLTIIKNWKNLDLDYSIPGEVWLNYISNQLEPTDIKSIESYEVEKPQLTYASGDTYVLKFTDITSTDYKYDSLFISRNNVLLNEYVTENDTVEIPINAIPLPIVNKAGINTADHFVDDKTKLKLILFDGTNGNTAQEIEALLIPAIYENDYSEWLNIRIKGVLFKWRFKMIEEDLRLIIIRNKVFAYQNKHIIKSINKDLIHKGIWSVELETLSLLP
ncbi:hypothetical protein JJL45_05080 [Tamlana sp. s12]|uniref:hypothetical protein n=1 Tax=Tamlana sp. s12 TaxID=1630406 RepID=UPI0007FD42C9|nr:hypothetical protein [Tamlana sp. s12]OBQ56122.1 hypothetical protein VQ01_06975 [Tamlana sp. s12]QQY83364.1 hypothetical protein JJL45_05080 [Tamlana sp. s12]